VVSGSDDSKRIVFSKDLGLFGIAKIFWPFGSHHEKSYMSFEFPLNRHLSNEIPSDRTKMQSETEFVYNIIRTLVAQNYMYIFL